MGRETEFPSHGGVGLGQRTALAGFHLPNTACDRLAVLLLLQRPHCASMRFFVNEDVDGVRVRMFDPNGATGAGVHFFLQVGVKSGGHTSNFTTGDWAGQSNFPKFATCRSIA